MEFKRREEYSIDKSGAFFEISQDEFVHCSISYNPEVITWMKGNKRIKQPFDYDSSFGVVGNSFFFEKDEIIKIAELINDAILITEFVKIEKGINVIFKRNCLHYFIERENNPNVSSAIPIHEDYRSKNGISFNVSIDELEKFNLIHVHDNFLFCITNNENSTSIRRYQSGSEEYLEKNELPRMFNEAVIFNYWIFYLNLEGDLVSVYMSDFSYDIMKTNLEEWSEVFAIDTTGMVNVQTYWDRSPVHLLTAKLPEKYIKRANMYKLIDMNKKRIGELERKVETGKKGKEELERRLQAEKKEKEELVRRLQTEKKDREKLERRLQTEKKDREELQRRLQIEKKDKDELERTLQDEKKDREELERRLQEEKKDREELERKLQTEKKDKDELERTLQAEKKDREELERRLQAEKKDREEQERTLQAEKKDREELDRRLQAEKKDREELERRLRADKKDREEQERTLQAEKKDREKLERRLKAENIEKENEQKDRNELKRRLQTEKKEKEELERRLQTEKKEKEELENRLQAEKKEKENEQKNRNELERRLEDKEKKEKELLITKDEVEKRNAILGVEMTDLKLKYNKLLVKVRY